MMESFWTIQHPAKWELFQSTGILTGEEAYIEPSFINAYKWMVSKMKHLSNPANVRYPVWAWYRYNEKSRRPDLRGRWHWPRGEEAVLIEFREDGNNVLLTDHCEWHMVLNSGEDAFAYGYSEDDDGTRYYWDDIIIKPENREIEPLRSIQATMWQVRLDQVVSVRRFKGR